jgi:hypothetical protein
VVPVLSSSLSLSGPLTVYQANVPATFSLQAFNSSGMIISNASSTCNMTIYNNTGGVEEKSYLTWDGVSWSKVVSASVMTPGRHGVVFYCLQGVQGGYLSGYFLVTFDGTGVIIALIPIIFAFLVIFGASMFDPDEHSSLRIFSHILSWVMVFTSMWLGTQVMIKFYNWSSFTDSIGVFGMILGMLVFALSAYWIVYIFYKIIAAIKEKKESRLNA